MMTGSQREGGLEGGEEGGLDKLKKLCVSV